MATQIEEKMNEKKTASSANGMSSFYANLLTKNKAFGALNEDKPV